MRGILGFLPTMAFCSKAPNQALVSSAIRHLAGACRVDMAMALRTRPFTRHASAAPCHGLASVPFSIHLHAPILQTSKLHMLHQQQQHDAGSALAARYVATAAAAAGDSKASSSNRSSSSGKKQPKILVVGAGVVGMTTALRLLRQIPDCHVSVVAHQLGWETTTAGAAGLWGPFKLWDTPEALVARWSADTLDHLYDLLHSTHAEEAGISLRGVHALQETMEPPPAWAHVVDQFSPVSERVLTCINKGHTLGPPIVHGWFYNSIACEGGPYLRYLHRQILKHGGQVFLTPQPLSHLSQVADAAVQSSWQVAPLPDVQPPPAHPESAPASSSATSNSIIGITLEEYLQRGGLQPEVISEFPPPSPTTSPPFPPAQASQPVEIGSHEFDAVVNCTGIGSYQLLQDKAVSPIRGQVLRVHAPWVTAAYLLPAERVQGMIYIIPNNYSIVLGGTGLVGDWSTQPSTTDRQRIVAGCVDLLPSLSSARIMNDWVGLRPGRTSVRLELDSLSIAAAGGQQRTVPMVHNYGHGGSGLTLAWGCAGDVVQLVKDLIT